MEGESTLAALDAALVLRLEVVEDRITRVSLHRGRLVQAARVLEGRSVESALETLEPMKSLRVVFLGGVAHVRPTPSGPFTVMAEKE